MVEREERAEDEWLGCACPRCHVLFRVRAATKARLAECPRCEAVVAVPRERQIPSAGTQFRKIDAEREGDKSAKRRKRVRRKVRKKKKSIKRSSDLEWDEAGRSSASPRGPSRGAITVLVVALVIGAIGVAVLFLLRGDEGEENGLPAESDSSQPTGGSPANLLGGGQGQDGQSSGKIGDIEMAATLSGIQKAVSSFLLASNVDELVNHVRGGEVVEARIRDYYQSNPYSATPHRKVGYRGRVLKSGSLWAVDVALEDQTVRQIALEQVGEEYLIDWESWVGYSEMSWEDFLDSAPVEPKLFRVLCSAVEYYNYAFGDDERWVSYLIESPDHAHLLYGYVRPYSEEATKLRSLGGESGQPAALVLKLRFPQDSADRNQVLIDEVVTSGWVLSDPERIQETVTE